MQQIIETFIRQLAEFPPLDHVTNQYAYHQDPTVDQANAFRRHNLRLYLGHMLDRKPNDLWIGEAPGYRGCRMTGVPFTSEFILVHGESSLLEDTNTLANRSPDLFGLSQGYKPTRDEWGFEKEPSATMMWQLISQMQMYPLLWNAFPFHPHYPDQEDTNRSPTRDEIISGKIFLQEFFKIFDIKKVAAIGRAAEGCLEKLDVKYKYIRHPSFGGKSKFTQGVVEFTNDPNLNQTFKN
jgi:hypothetical protein